MYDLEEVPPAIAAAQASRGVIYSWKSMDRCNWLGPRISIADVLGLVVLPRRLPAYIHTPADPAEEDGKPW